MYMNPPHLPNKKKLWLTIVYYTSKLWHYETLIYYGKTMVLWKKTMILWTNNGTIPITMELRFTRGKTLSITKDYETFIYNGIT